MSYKLVWDTDHVLHCRFSGIVDFNQVNDASNEFLEDTRSEHASHAVWDFSDMTNFDIRKHQASEIAATDCVASHYTKPLKAAFITSDQSFAELVKQYIVEMDAYGTHWTNKLFDSIEDAMDWVAATSHRTMG
jgi:trans-aconitate methyltransferase